MPAASAPTAPAHRLPRAPGIDPATMDPNPFAAFGEWFAAADSAGLGETNAMNLATAGADGRVSCRVVLLKAWDEAGFVFFTNYASDKARQIAENPHVALLFPWLKMSRQVQIRGRAEKIRLAESVAYFLKRPFKSRVGAWVSAQSSVVSSRALLEAKFEQMLRRFADGEVPLPDAWGGYRVVPEEFEFWQSGTHRLHDRVLYRQAAGDWTRERLAP